MVCAALKACSRPYIEALTLPLAAATTDLVFAEALTG
jgi:hypothetical protein